MTEHQYAIAFLKGFALTQLTEIPVVWYLLARHFRASGAEVPSLRLVAAAFFANMATLPYLWFVAPEFLNFTGTVLWGEAAVLAVEALFYRSLLGASPRAAFFASLAANTLSVLVGLAVMPPRG